MLLDLAISELKIEPMQLSAVSCRVQEHFTTVGHMQTAPAEPQMHRMHESRIYPPALNQHTITHT